MTHILGDFTYYYGTSTGSMTDCQNDNLTVCGGDNRQSIQFNKATCAGSGMYTSKNFIYILSFNGTTVNCKGKNREKGRGYPF